MTLRRCAAPLSHLWKKGLFCHYLEGDISMKWIGTAFLLLITCFSLLQAQPWKVTGQIRHRFESAGTDFNETDFDNFNLLRTRIGVLFQPEDGVEGYVEFQDSRKFGEEDNTLSDGSAANIDLHQGYFAIKNAFNLPVDAKVGRMEVNFGPQRLVGAVGWHNIGRSFDGILLNLHGSNFKLNTFWLDEVETGGFDDTGDRDVFGGYGDWKISENYSGQPFLIWQRESPSNMLNRYTLAFYVKGAAGALSHETEFAFQGGTLQDLDVSAYMAALNVAYKLGVGGRLQPVIGGGVDYLSGDDDPTDDKHKVFDTLYATNHKYYGYMDMFLNIPVHTLGLGLMDIHLKGGIAIASKTKLNGAAHLFRANEDFVLTSGATSKAFGSEIDLTLNHVYSANVTMVVGASLFSPGDVFKQTRGGDLSTWFYLMTVVGL
jgi:hypothetical protein